MGLGGGGCCSAAACAHQVPHTLNVLSLRHLWHTKSFFCALLHTRCFPLRNNPEREAQLRNPEDAFFKRYAGEASSRQITLDVFLGTNGYADLASLSSIPRYTCGQVRQAGSTHDTHTLCEAYLTCRQHLATVGC